MSTQVTTPAPPAVIPDRTYGPADLARIFNTSRWTVMNWRRQGLIPPGMKFGKTVRWTPHQVASILAAKGG